MLFLVSVLALLVATVTSDSLQTMKTVSQSGRDAQAKYAAYAGMEIVMNELRKEDRFIGAPIKSPNHGRKEGALGELERVKYDVMIWNNMRDKDAASAPDEAIETEDGVMVQPDTVYMVSTGSDTGSGEQVVLTSMAGTARRVRPVFEDAAYARSKMILRGNVLVDAWDSGGGWTQYIKGEFPGSQSSSGGGQSGGGGQGGGQNEPEPTVQDYKATLGTDSKTGRTMRLLGEAKLNGHYRIGPGVADKAAFGEDTGSASAPSGDDDVSMTYAVATATSPDTQIAGVEEATGSSKKFHKLDDKTTEMPRFMAPYETDDLQEPPVVNNPTREREVDNPYGPGKMTVIDPPAPVDLNPGGYKSVTVGGNQTLRLSPGVYYFQEEMNVSGKIVLTGSDPVIVFIGKKAVFTGAEINKDGRTSALQLCFTDEEKDEDVLSELIDELLPDFEAPSSSSAPVDEEGVPTGSSGSSLRDYVSRLVAPNPEAKNPETQEGASVLNFNETEFYGSVSGKNLVVKGKGGEIFGGVMANVVRAEGTDLHQDLALKGSNLMNAGGWSLEGVHQLR